MLVLAGHILLNLSQLQKNFTETRCYILGLFPFPCSDIIHIYMDLVKHSQGCLSPSLLIFQGKKMHLQLFSLLSCLIILAAEISPHLPFRLGCPSKAEL